MKSPPILCLSANPAIDRRLRIESLEPGRIHRAISAENFPGGKAAHVAMVAKALGARTVWLGFLGGRVGDQFREDFGNLKIGMAEVHTRARTRMNLELIETSGRITEILEPGEKLAPAELRAMNRIFVSGLRGKWHGAVAVVSGSLPPGFSPSFYRTLISAARVGRVRVLVDTSGQALQVSLKARPFFIKPNLEEAEELLGHKLRNSNALVGALRAFVRMGAETAAISMGSNGLVWIEQRDGPVWFARPPQLKAISTVGSGDATVAGFAVAMSRGLKAEEAVRLAAACGAANCLARSPGRVALNDVTKLSPQVVVRRIA